MATNTQIHTKTTNREDYIMASRTMERDWEKRTITILEKEYDRTTPGKKN
jgi:hypothetical protein